MKTVRFTAYLFYKYYSTGSRKDIAYFSTLCALVMLIGLHIFQITLVFDKFDLLPFSKTEGAAKNYLTIALFLIPIFLLVAFFVRKSDLETMDFAADKIKRGNTMLLLYIIGSIALLILLSLYRQGKL